MGDEGILVDDARARATFISKAPGLINARRRALINAVVSGASGGR
jgi:hypothetical protein